MSNPMILQVGADILDLKAQLKAGKVDIAEFANGVEEIGHRFDSAGVSGDRLRSSLQTIDGVLNAVGVNISAEQRALVDLASASGKTAGQLGALATAGLVVGAAIGGWNVGRRIAEFLELDAALAQGTAALMEWGDAAQQVGQAQRDVVEVAIKRGANVLISYTDALKFNDEWMRKNRESWKAYAEAIEALTLAGDDWKKTLTTIDGETINAIKYYLDAGVSQKNLAAAYGLTAAQVQAVSKSRDADIESLKLHADAEKEMLAAAEARVKQLQEWDELVAEVEVGTGKLGKVLESVDGTLVDWAEHLLASGVSAQKVAEYYGLTRAQVSALEDDLKAKTKATEDATAADEKAAAAAKAHAAAIDEEAAAAVAAFRASNDAVMGMDTSFEGWNATVMASAGALGDVKKAVDGVTMSFGSLSEAMEAGLGEDIKALLDQGYTLQEAFAVRYAQVYGAKPSIHIPDAAELANRPHRAMGGPVSANQAYVVGDGGGPELFVPSTNGTIIPNGASVGGGVQVIQLVVDGRVLASVMTDHLTKQMRQGRQWPA